MDEQSFSYASDRMRSSLREQRSFDQIKIIGIIRSNESNEELNYTSVFGNFQPGMCRGCYRRAQQWRKSICQVMLTIYRTNTVQGQKSKRGPCESATGIRRKLLLRDNTIPGRKSCCVCIGFVTDDAPSPGKTESLVNVMHTVAQAILLTFPCSRASFISF